MSIAKLSLSLFSCLTFALAGCGSDGSTDASVNVDATAARPDATGFPDATVVTNPDAEPVTNPDAEPVHDDAAAPEPDSGVADTGVVDTGVAPDSGVAAAPLWADVYRGAIAQNCSCHNNGGQSGGLTFPNARAAIADVHAELVTERANERCGGTRHPRVTIGDANTSLLYLKVAGASCGSRMPLGGGALPQAQQDLIRDWINGGAQ